MDSVDSTRYSFVRLIEKARESFHVFLYDAILIERWIKANTIFYQLIDLHAYITYSIKTHY